MKRNEKIDLIVRYMDDLLSSEEYQAFDEMLRTDSEAAQLFYDLSMQNVLLHRIGKETAVSKPVPAPVSLFRRIVWAAAAAVIMLIAGLTFFFSMERYPAPEGIGDYTIEDGGTLERNVVITVNKKTTEFKLGGYCTIFAEPATVLALKGEPLKESVSLMGGTIFCDVDTEKGSFAVKTKLGDILVTGTEFTVEYVPGTEKTKAKLRVKVDKGSVDLKTEQWGDFLLTAGKEEVLPPEDPVTIASEEKKPVTPKIKIPDIPETDTAVYGGPMATDGKYLYTAAGSFLSRVDLKHENPVMRKDLSKVNIKEGEPMSLAAYGHARLLLKGSHIYMLRNGTVFVFKQETLKFVTFITIMEKKRGELRHKKENETRNKEGQKIF